MTEAVPRAPMASGSDPSGSDPSASDPSASDPSGSDPSGSDPFGSDPAAGPVGALVERIRAELRQAADPSIAPGQQAYMRSAMPFLGVRVPQVRRIVRAAAGTMRVPADELIAAATTLWRAADHREERYAATELLGLRPARGRLDALPTVTEVIVTGAWWDHVDAVAALVGAILRAHPDALEAVVRGWSTDPDRWLRRVSIICQLDFKAATDRRLLADTIAANLDDPDFFLRKAIGWALRQYARTDPDWVRAFVAAHRDTLSPLSYREATKHLT